MSPDAFAVAKRDDRNATTGLWELPSGWAWAPLSEVTEAPATVEPRKQGHAFNYIDVSAIAAGKIRSAHSLQAERAPSRARQPVKLGDTLFSGVRVYLKNIALVDELHDGAIASTAFCVLRPTAAVDPRYLYFFVNWQQFISRLLPLQRGNSPPAVLDSDIKAQPIPIAPLNEQRRIVARIDELVAEIDEGEAALERARQGLDTWRRALLKAAVTGELTRDWREANRPAETGADLLARIRAEREALVPRSHQSRRATPKDVEPAKLPELPNGWVWCRMAEVVLSDGRNGISVKGSNAPPGTPALRLDALADQGIDYSRIRYIEIGQPKTETLSRLRKKSPIRFVGPISSTAYSNTLIYLAWLGRTADFFRSLLGFVREIFSSHEPMAPST